MYPKRLSILAIALIFSLAITAQDFSGTWIGVYSSDFSAVRKTSRFALQLQQKGRAVYGVYTIGDSTNLKKADCACSISGQLSKKDKTAVNLYKERLLESTIPDDVCELVNYLETHFVEKEGKFYITGKWFGRMESTLRPDGAGGSISVQKVSDKTMVDVDQYFSNLEKIVKKFNPGDTTYNK